MILFDTVTMSFGGVRAIDRCSFEVPAGIITGLIGPNGAGKTTAFNVIAGTFPPTQGRVVLDGSDITRLAAHERQRLGLARTFQLSHEFPRMTVLENLMVAAESKAGESVFNAIFRPGRYQAAERETLRKAMEILEFLEIEHLKLDLAGTLSGGQKKLLELGRALMQDPKIILLDEIGAGINRTLLGKIADKIKQINSEHGYTICLIEHDLDYVSRLCDQVIVLAQGQVLTVGGIEEVRRDERVIEAYFGGGKYEARETGAGAPA